MSKFIEENRKFLKDCKHMLWLTKQAIVHFFKGDIGGMQEVIYWIKAHWEYRSKQIKQGFYRKGDK